MNMKKQNEQDRRNEKSGLTECVEGRPTGTHADPLDCNFHNDVARVESQEDAEISDLLRALRDYEQCDAIGVYCKVSRQAVDEAIELIERRARPVPREPSEAMLDAAQACDTEGEDDARRAYKMIWQAMHDAARREA